MQARQRHPGRGSVLLIVLWAIAIAAVVTASIQLFSTRQATLGRDALQRVQARWAARSGVEQMIAVMESHSMIPEPDDAWAMVRDMEEVSSGRMHFASYDIRHHVDGRDWAGPLDEHSRLNINAASGAMLWLFDDMTPDVMDAIFDWRDEDEEPRAQGAEEAFYANLRFPYKPRNDYFQSIAELELVAGIWPEHVRGSDWNLNNRLDANENDGELSWPIDAGDGILDAGWSEWLTARSVRGGMSGTGQPRIFLRDADVEILQERIDLSEQQARMLLAFGRNPSNNLGTLLTTPLETLGPDGQPQQQNNRGRRGGRASASPRGGGQSGGQNGLGGSNQEMEPLTTEQLRAVFRECTMDNPKSAEPQFGKININTVPESFLRELFPNEQATVDDIVYLRSSSPEGIGSMVDLLDIRGVSDQTLNTLTQHFDVYSNVYTISSVGRSDSTGLRVEMIVTVDRSTLPARIIEYREQ